MTDLLQIFQHQYFSVIAGGVGGIVTAWLTQRILNRRGVFSYSVTHSRVGVTTEDPVFGNVAVTLNGQPISNLYFSTLEMKNESLNDYENVSVRVYTNDTKLMTEQTQLLDNPINLEWSEKYNKQLAIETGKTPTDAQWNIYNGQREYVIPIFNRNQVIRIAYLNSANSVTAPTIWLSIAVKGVKLKFKVPQNQILGVPQAQAAVVGILIGLIVLVALASLVSEPWAIALSAMAYGFSAQVPGAYAIKLIRRVREAIGG